MTKPRNPRMLRHGALTAGAICAFGTCGSANAQPETFSNPPELVSADGELRTSFVVVEALVQVAGKTVSTLVYNGEFMPPLLRVRPGDTIYLELINETVEPTNEHYHGLNVSPRVNADATVSDNVLISIEPGTLASYRIHIPETHNPGLYWYHAHLHGLAEHQVMGGLSGGLIVEGVLDPFPELQGIRERVFLLKDIQITADGTLPDDIDPSADTNRTVNGLTQPTIELKAGELQFWRFANIGANMYYRIVLDGHVFQELARDGNRHTQLVEITEILLPPGARSEVLVLGTDTGEFSLRTLAFDTGPAGDSYGEDVLATVFTQGAVETPAPALPPPEAFPPVEDLRTLPVAQSRTIIVGKFVYHCHILEHEDGGMMAIAEVVNPPGAPPPPPESIAHDDFDRDVVLDTLAAFQAGSYCGDDAPRRASPAIRAIVGGIPGSPSRPRALLEP